MAIKSSFLPSNSEDVNVEDNATTFGLPTDDA